MKLRKVLNRTSKLVAQHSRMAQKYKKYPPRQNGKPSSISNSVLLLRKKLISPGFPNYLPLLRANAASFDKVDLMPACKGTSFPSNEHALRWFCLKNRARAARIEDALNLSSTQER
jgi:hypothetical protein